MTQWIRCSGCQETRSAREDSFILTHFPDGKHKGPAKYLCSRECLYSFVMFNRAGEGMILAGPLLRRIWIRLVLALKILFPRGR